MKTHLALSIIVIFFNSAILRAADKPVITDGTVRAMVCSAAKIKHEEKEARAVYEYITGLIPLAKDPGLISRLELLQDVMSEVAALALVTQYDRTEEDKNARELQFKTCAEHLFLAKLSLSQWQPR